MGNVILINENGQVGASGFGQKIKQNIQAMGKFREEIKQIQANIEEQKKLKQQAKTLKNIQQIKLIKGKLYQRFLQVLDRKQFKKQIPSQQNVRHYIILGNISQGKSSLINYCLNTNEQVGVGETTQKPKCVLKYQVPNSNKIIYIWDTPGINEQFCLESVQTLGYFKSADRILVLNSKSINNTLKMLQVVSKIKKDECYYVRTKVDTIKKTDAKTLQEILSSDKQVMMKNGINISILAVSAHKNIDFQDNKRLKELMTTYKE